MSIEKVRAYFETLGIVDRIREFDQSSATVELAAEAVGVEPARIAKTLSFDVKGTPTLIVFAGDARADNKRFKARFHTKAKMLSHDDAARLVGHAVGGVCPFAVNGGVEVYLDESLRRFTTVFPAAGSSNSAIELTIPELERYSHALDWVDVGKGWRPEELEASAAAPHGHRGERLVTTYSPTVQNVLEHNRAFVASGDWRDHAAPGRPAKQLAVVACMDTRLTRLLPDALGLANGDAKLIKVAGATIVEPYGEVMRSLIVAIAELGVTDIMVVGHTHCGTCGMESAHMLDELVAAGVPRERIDAAIAADPRAERFLNGFARLDDEVARNVAFIREHPLIPDGVRVYGFTIDIETGELTPVDA